MQKHGDIILRNGVRSWPHELNTAIALADAGYIVEFICKNEIEYTKSADVLMNDVIWEFKAPKSNKLRKIEKTLREALHQSSYIVYDSRRIKGLKDSQIKNELQKWAYQLKSLRGLLFIAKNNTVITIK